jgi:hypothetical protein
MIGIGVADDERIERLNAARLQIRHDDALARERTSSR